jgi:hypothetical protein
MSHKLLDVVCYDKKGIELTSLPNLVAQSQKMFHFINIFRNGNIFLSNTMHQPKSPLRASNIAPYLIYWSIDGI